CERESSGERQGEATTTTGVTAAVSKEPRMGASLLRLHFHDCFVQASHLSPRS
uniref:Plant heme peroxidase family profile domain-containing protein n=1 Tax=Aegilops tauschii subsp. strangulata TaxID=200361 RepID=A0A453I5D8_AEGTS